MNEILETKRLYAVKIDDRTRYLFLTRYGRYGVLYKRKGERFKREKEIEMVHNVFPFHEEWIRLIEENMLTQHTVEIHDADDSLHEAFIKDMDRRKKNSIRAGMVVGYGFEIAACLVGAFLLWYVPWALKQQFILSFVIALTGLIVMPLGFFMLGFLSIKLMKRLATQSPYDVLFSSEEQTKKEVMQIIRETFGIDPDDFDE